MTANQWVVSIVYAAAVVYGVVSIIRFGIENVRKVREARRPDTTAAVTWVTGETTAQRMRHGARFGRADTGRGK